MQAFTVRQAYDGLNIKLKIDRLSWTSQSAKRGLYLHRCIFITIRFIRFFQAVCFILETGISEPWVLCQSEPTFSYVLPILSSKQHCSDPSEVVEEHQIRAATSKVF